MTPRINWPEGKSFAFTIFDDTDHATVENNQAVYGHLADSGLRTTKSVWAFAGSDVPEIPGVTCDDPAYLAMCRGLQRQGFEITLHNVTFHTSSREETIRGFDRFRDLFGHDPAAFANHAGNREGIYWGPARLSGWRRLAYMLVQRGQKFEGHIPSSPLFWGDICRERVRHVRNFTFTKLDTLNCCPFMPYHDPLRPHVRQWFASSNAADCAEFRNNVTEKAVESLAADGGACILYTHFGKRFHQHGSLDSRFKEIISWIGKLNGWFVPAGVLLDYLASLRPEPRVLTDGERRQLELRWLRDQAGGLARKFFQ